MRQPRLPVLTLPPFLVVLVVYSYVSCIAVLFFSSFFFVRDSRTHEMHLRRAHPALGHCVHVAVQARLPAVSRGSRQVLSLLALLVHKYKY
jgi:hypothetical protein